MKVFTAISEYRTFYLLPLCHESASLSALKANNITMSWSAGAVISIIHWLISFDITYFVLSWSVHFEYALM